MDLDDGRFPPSCSTDLMLVKPATFLGSKRSEDMEPLKVGALLTAGADCALKLRQTESHNGLILWPSVVAPTGRWRVFPSPSWRGCQAGDAATCAEQVHHH